MSSFGFRHHDRGEAPKPLKSEAITHQDRMLTRLVSILDADDVALATYPQLDGKLGTYEFDPAIVPQLDAMRMIRNDNVEASPAPGTAEVAGRFANGPTTTIEMPAGSTAVPAETDQNRADFAAWEGEVNDISGMPADQPEPNILEEQVPSQGAREAYNEFIS